MNILGLTREHKIAWKSGRKFALKFSPQADFNFVQPWNVVMEMIIFSYESADTYEDFGVRSRYLRHG